MKNRKATVIEASVLVISGALAAGLAVQLADRGVSIPAITCTVLAILTTGQYLANQLTQALRTTLYTCPTKGCPVFIRTTAVSDTELTRLRSLATDHSKHGSDR